MTAASTDSRIHVLDVLRGIALLGMFLVHFSYYQTGGGRADGIYQRIVELFFEERFWTMFAILFGVGFAIQFRRADARGDRYLLKYFRRLAALAVFGLIAHGIFGFNVLLGYAMWGLALPLFLKWPPRALVAAVIVSAMSFNLYGIANTAYGVARVGETAYKAERAAAMQQALAFRKANDEAKKSADLKTVLVARAQHVRWLYVQPFSFLPVNTLTLFLLGLLGLRLGLFDRPQEHRRLIVGLMIFGVASWAFELWLWDWSPTFPPGTPMLRQTVLTRLAYGMGLIRGMWLAFTYIGAVLLLVSWKPVWLRRLAAFGWAGRMALTNYMLQIVILDLMFDKYALGLSFRPLVGMACGVALFLINAAWSRWWLARHLYGPLEWLWRSATYARWQPWRTTARGAEVAESV